MANKPETVDSVETINELIRRVEKLEDIQRDTADKTKVITKWSRWAEEQVKPIYGMGMVGAVLGQLAEKLEK